METELDNDVLSNEELDNSEYDDDLENDESNVSQSDFTNSSNKIENVDTPVSTTDLMLIAGKRGSGKSNLLLFLVKSLQKLNVNYLLVDPLKDLQNHLPNEKRILYIPYGNRSKFDALLLKLFHSNWQGILVVDEADRFFPNGQKPLTPIENYFIQIGRHHKIGGLFVTRRLTKLHPDLTTQCSRLFMFKHWNRNDIKYLQESSLGEYASLLTGLKRYHFVYLNPDIDYAQICTPVPKQK